MTAERPPANLTRSLCAAQTQDPRETYMAFDERVHRFVWEAVDNYDLIGHNRNGPTWPKP
jgi:hypothetical protein